MPYIVDNGYSGLYLYILGILKAEKDFQGSNYNEKKFKKELFQFVSKSVLFKKFTNKEIARVIYHK